MRQPIIQFHTHSKPSKFSMDMGVVLQSYSKFTTKTKQSAIIVILL